jgi:hypothetical protein
MSRNGNGNNNVGQATQEAVSSSTQTAAGSASVSPALPGGATGVPLYFEVSGDVAGYATINVGTNAQYVAANNPNGGPVRKAIPRSAFPGPVNSVPITLTFAGAGTLTVTVGFR